MNYEETYIKLLTGELEYIGGLQDDSMRRPFNWAIKEFYFLREALDDCYHPILAELYFRVVNALLIYKRRIENHDRRKSSKKRS